MSMKMSHRFFNGKINFIKPNQPIKECRSIMGNNLRNIMLQLNMDNIEFITIESIMKMQYYEEECQINMVEEIIKVKRGKFQLENFNWKISTGKFQLENFNWKISTGKFQLENFNWKISTGKFQLENFNWKISTGKFQLENFNWKISTGKFQLENFNWKISTGKFQLENFSNTEIDQLLDCLWTT